MADKNCGRYEGTLPEREITHHIGGLNSTYVINALIAGGYLTDEDILQFYQKGTIYVYVYTNTINHIFKVEVTSWVLEEETLTDMAQRVAEAFLKYEEDMYPKYQKLLSDTSWKELRYKLKVPFKFLKGEMLDSYAQAIKEGAFWKNPFAMATKNAIERGIFGLDIEIHSDECFAEITAYIKDIERAYDYDDCMERCLFRLAYSAYKEIRHWEFYTCFEDTLQKVANG